MTSTPKPALRSPFERARQDAIPAPLDVCLQKGVFGMFKSPMGRSSNLPKTRPQNDLLRFA